METAIEQIQEPYFIVEKASCLEVAHEVSKFINVGWTPLGGITGFANGGRVVFLQAVVRLHGTHSDAKAARVPMPLWRNGSRLAEES
jgi:hypothetical protein